MNANMALKNTKIWAQVHPNARWNEVQGEKDGIWQLRIAAPPVRGRANQELISYLSNVLQVNKSDLAIDKGLTSKQKVIEISGLSLGQVRARLNASTRQQRFS